MKITITHNTKKLESRIKTTIQKLKNTKSLMDSLGNMLMEEYGENVFAKKGTPSNKWKGLDAKTLRARASGWGYYGKTSGGGSEPLVWSGRLKKGFKKVSTTKQVTVTNTTPYFKYHQQGGGKLPARPMLHLDPPLQRKIEKEINDFVKKSLV